MDSAAITILSQEARALSARLAGVRPFGLLESMVPAAALAPSALIGIERSQAEGFDEIRARVAAFLQWLEQGPGQDAPPREAQRRFALLRMRFNAVLSDYEIFSAVLTQRSEHDNGVWLAGLEVAATDTLDLNPAWYAAPPLICYLDRGFGAAIRRARTRLPGGRENPVAIVRIPRERMIGCGIASSLVHEVGHQGAELLRLVPSIRPLLAALARTGGPDDGAWQLWERWISEIVADLWSVSRLGVTSTLGLLGVMSLPRAFVFRISTSDPHPAPWIRLKLSCAMGDALYPHPQWAQISRTWDRLYPQDGERQSRRFVLDSLLRTMPAFVKLLVGHSPPSLGGLSLERALALPEIRPRELAVFYRRSPLTRDRLAKTRPSTAFAAVGQARLEGVITPARETQLIAELLEYWALRRSLASSKQAG
ncbi:MAG TPA: hypothetical protein VGK29_12515 [Paludibaculum sp.]|jgi:hypothetical protein